MALQQNRLPTPEKPLYADAVASACQEAEPPCLQQLQAQGQASQRKKTKGKSAAKAAPAKAVAVAAASGLSTAKQADAVSPVVLASARDTAEAAAGQPQAYAPRTYMEMKRRHAKAFKAVLVEAGISARYAGQLANEEWLLTPHYHEAMGSLSEVERKRRRLGLEMLPE